MKKILSKKTALHNNLLSGINYDRVGLVVAIVRSSKTEIINN